MQIQGPLHTDTAMVLELAVKSLPQEESQSDFQTFHHLLGSFLTNNPKTDVTHPLFEPLGNRCPAPTLSLPRASP
jgi:hypothetical protein